MKIIAGYFFLLLLSYSSLAQENDQLKRLNDVFEEFEYNEAITFADSLLLNKNLSIPIKNDILLIKAISHYSLSQETQSRKCFIEMIKNDRNVQLDSNSVAPKILTLFLSVKEEFQDIIPQQPLKNDDINKDMPFLPETEFNNLTLHYENFTEAIYKSILIPGWGHYSYGSRTKGIILSGVSLINLAGLIYYSIDAREKEKIYLGYIDPSQIQTAYSSYNESYKTRNIFIASFIAIWLYTQIDLLMNSKSWNSSDRIPIQTGYSAEHSGFFVKFYFPMF
jgi:hypothetical protein